ncbi:MAG: glycosyltransferase family 39 protein [Acidobacteria bacterium]|nr:glycosyltransferase family 39 protein [Acidobacteriota bacterium]
MRGTKDEDRGSGDSPGWRLGLAGVLVAALVLLATGARWGLPGWQTWAVDAIHPEQVERARDRGFSDGWHERYPPLHFYLLSSVYWTADTISGGEAPTRQAELSRHILLGRWLSLAMTLGSLLLLTCLGHRLFDLGSGVLAAALAATQPPLVYYAKTTNLEAPYLFWLLLALFFLVRLLDDGRARDAVGLGVAAALAVGTKDQAYAFFLLAPLPMLWAAGRRDADEARPGSTVAGWWRALRTSRLAWVLAAGAGVLAAIYLVPGNARGFLAHVELITGDASQPYRQFAPSPAGYASLFTLVARQVGVCLGVGGLVASLAGVALAWRDRHGDPRIRRTAVAGLLLACLSYELFFVGVVGYSFLRFQLPVALVLTLFGGHFLRRLLQPESLGLPGRTARVAGATAVAVVLAIGLVRGAMVDLHLLKDGRYLAEEWVAERAAELEQPVDGALCIGRRRHCPRLATVRWDRVLRDPGTFLENHEPSWIAINVDDLRSEAERRFYSDLTAGTYNYRHVFTATGEVPLPLLPRKPIRSSFRFVNPRIDVFERVDEDASDQDPDSHSDGAA